MLIRARPLGRGERGTGRGGDAATRRLANATVYPLYENEARREDRSAGGFGRRGFLTGVLSAPGVRGRSRIGRSGRRLCRGAAVAAGLIIRVSGGRILSAIRRQAGLPAAQPRNSG